MNSYVATNKRVCPVCGYSFLSFERNPKKIQRDMRAYRLQTGYQKEILRVGETFEMGVYNGKKIVWRVLEIREERALVITEYIIEYAQFNRNMLSLSSTWDKCTLRIWMNSKWLFEIFNERERERILANRTIAYGNPKYATLPGGEVEDWLFLLSIQEAEHFFKDKEERIAFPESYDSESSKPEEYASLWWLRTPGDQRFSIADVDADGSIFFEGDDSSDKCGVRPAMWLDLSGLEDIEELARPLKEPIPEEMPSDSETEQNVSEKPDPAPIIKKRKAGRKKRNPDLEPLSLEVGMYHPMGTYAGEWLHWKVLAIKGGMALLLCEDGIDTLPYHTAQKNVSWEDSQICNWLNNVFVVNAFSKEELNRIVFPQDFDPEDRFLLYDATDAVFFLSMQEVKQYLGKAPDRITYATSHAIRRGANRGRISDSCSWWLRDAGAYGSTAARVRNNGRIDWIGVSVTSSGICIRPAVRIWL